MKSLVVQTIAHCNELFAAPNLHPLVSLIRWPKAKPFPVSLRFGFYTVWLRGTQGCCPAAFGQGTCDFCEGTLLLVQPGNRVEGSWWTDTGGAKEGWLLCFHPSLFEENRMSGRLESYTFFRYAGNEALHLSLRERKIVEREVQYLEEELGRGVDEYSCAILADRILLLLDYVARSYGFSLTRRCTFSE